MKFLMNLAGMVALAAVACSDDGDGSTTNQTGGTGGTTSAGGSAGKGTGGTMSGTGGSGTGGSNTSKGGSGGSTNGGSTNGGTGGTGTGGGSEAECNTCASAQNNGAGAPCWDVLQACLGDTGCTAWFSCAQNNCQGSDFNEACFADCDSNASGSEAVTGPVQDCLCEGCAEACAPRCN
jgi:hypothetical protein